jgi:hypothetical protein
MTKSIKTGIEIKTELERRIALDHLIAEGKAVIQVGGLFEYAIEEGQAFNWRVSVYIGDGAACQQRITKIEARLQAEWDLKPSNV